MPYINTQIKYNKETAPVANFGGHFYDKCTQFSRSRVIERNVEICFHVLFLGYNQICSYA
jgi:hypothetical protein